MFWLGVACGFWFAVMVDAWLDALYTHPIPRIHQENGRESLPHWRKVGP